MARKLLILASREPIPDRLLGLAGSPTPQRTVKHASVALRARAQHGPPRAHAKCPGGVCIRPGHKVARRASRRQPVRKAGWAQFTTVSGAIPVPERNEVENLKISCAPEPADELADSGGHIVVVDSLLDLPDNCAADNGAVGFGPDFPHVVRVGNAEANRDRRSRQ